MKTIGKGDMLKEFGLLIREAREKKGLLQKDVAAHLGISRAYYCYIESGSRDIPFTLVIPLCCILDLNIGVLKNLIKK